MLGVKALGCVIATVLTWQAFQSWIVQQAVLSDARAVIIVILSGITAVMASVTVLDVLNGGPVTAITADTNGLTFHRWRNTYRVPACDLGEVVAFRPGLLASVHLYILPSTGSGQQRVLTLHPWKWSGPVGSTSSCDLGMLAPMLYLFDPVVLPVSATTDQEVFVSAS
ncbi:MAG: hypothetical protein GIKADHBN_02014 [Phycisphaerales bacterium]|nr:hypothetical protein [Phycisphaerales bacterium]